VGILDGKVAIVTGAGHGVGRGHALDLAAAGARVVVNDLGGSPSGGGADSAPAEAVAAIIRERGGEAVANVDDVSDFDGARNLVRQAVDQFGGLDVLVNNAGILRDRMIFNMGEDDWDAVVKVHLKGHFAPSRFACEYWRNRAKEIDGPVHASVVCTSSLVGLEGNIGQTNYAAAKGGIAMFTIALALEMERYGVRANCVAPSGTTRLITMTQGTDAAPLEPDQYTAWDARDPGNVAPLVTWLASDLSRHVTGQVFLSIGPSITHYRPWTPNVTVTVPGGDRKWAPEEIGVALDTLAFGTRHPGLRRGSEFQGPGTSPFG
jgi:NAD(P)-dependent dehydrogenase (short-subunit alcohol dehydrogenase family)